MTQCPFCRIANAELEASLVFEDSAVVAFLDISPVNLGHTMVIPRRHVTSFTDLDPIETVGVFRVGQPVAKNLKVLLRGCEGVTLSLADGEIAGQEVPHCHLHVIPRMGDQFGWRRFGNRAERSQLDSMASQLSELLDSFRAG